MVDKITKSLKKLSAKEQKQLKSILSNVRSGKLTSLDVKKLKGRQDIYRVRKDSLRIIFSNKSGKIKSLTIERRGNQTYKGF